MYIFGILNKLLSTSDTPASNLQNNSAKDVADNKKETVQNQVVVEKEQITPPSATLNNPNKYKQDYKPTPYNKYPKKSFEQNKEKRPSNNCYALFAKDGDSFVGMYNNERREFRLAGIDTPEKGEPWAKQATAFLKEKIGKKVVYLELLGKDNYNRDIVEVFLDKEKTQHVNKMLLQEGFATAQRYHDKDGDKTHNILEHADNKISEVVAKLKNHGQWGGAPEVDFEDEFESNEDSAPTQSKFSPK